MREKLEELAKEFKNQDRKAIVILGAGLGVGTARRILENIEIQEYDFIISEEVADGIVAATKEADNLSKLVSFSVGVIPELTDVFFKDKKEPPSWKQKKMVW